MFSPNYNFIIFLLFYIAFNTRTMGLLTFAGGCAAFVFHHKGFPLIVQLRIRFFFHYGSEKDVSGLLAEDNSPGRSLDCCSRNSFSGSQALNSLEFCGKNL